MSNTGTIVGLVASVMVIFFLFCCYACDLRELLRCRRSRSVAGDAAATRSTVPRLHNVRLMSSDVVAALPVFVVCGPVAGDDKLECAVCLAEFGDGEKGRLLPRCGHSFHTECIDMWFVSHCTCPLCRLPVDHVEGLASIVR